MGEKIKENRSYYAMTTFNKLIKKIEKKKLKLLDAPVYFLFFTFPWTVIKPENIYFAKTNQYLRIE